MTGCAYDLFLPFLFWVNECLWYLCVVFCFVLADGVWWYDLYKDKWAKGTAIVLLINVRVFLMKTASNFKDT